MRQGDQGLPLESGCGGGGAALWTQHIPGRVVHVPHLFKKNISRGKQLVRFQIIFIHFFLCILFLIYLEKCF